MPQAQQLLSQTHPGGCFFGFNAAIDRKAAEQFSVVIHQTKQNGYATINLCLSSVGGVLDHAYYLFNIIEAIDINIISWNIGNIQSASNIIFLCGDTRYATPRSTFFFHQTGYDPPTGRVTEPYLTEKLKAVQYDDTRSAEIIAATTGKQVDDVRAWQNTELVMDTDAALAHGLIHDVRALVIPPNAFFHQVVV